MRTRYLVILLLFLFTANVSYAQMADGQVISFVKRATEQGKKPEEIMVELKGRGVTNTQLNRIKSNYRGDRRELLSLIESQVDGSKSKADTSVIRGRMQRDTSLMYEDEYFEDYLEEYIKKREAEKADTIFGQSVFKTHRLSFEPLLNIPTPENYKLAPSDEVIINIWGDTEMTIRQVITPEGSIFVEGLGPVYLNGLSISEANSRVKQLFSRIHQDLDSEQPRTDIKLTLGQIRSIRVNVLGEASMPGTYTLPSLATVFHALYSAGGVNSTGTLRNIRVYRSGKLYHEVDIYKFLISGDNSGDIVLQDGDNVVVSPYDMLVNAAGEVKRPMYYEMKEGETLDMLINYAGGYTGAAYKKNLSLTRKGDSEYRVYTISQEDIAEFPMSDGDSLNVGTILNRYENLVSIRGAVYRPGQYALSSKISTLKELLEYAEGVMGDAFMERALLYRESPDLTISVESVDLSKLLAGEIQDIPLKRNDELYVPSIYDISEGQYITIHGEVRDPTTYPFVMNMSVEEAILQAGGLLESASLMRVDVSRRIRNIHSEEEADVEATVYRLTLKDGFVIDAPKEFVLEPFDEVFVRKSPGYVEQQNVYAEGEVMFEGGYSKIKNNERISSLVERAGGLTSKAYIRGARIERQMSDDERRRVEAVLGLTEKEGADSLSDDMLDIGNTYYVGIELDKALQNPGSDFDLVLREGDRLIIPVYNNTVKISGAVMYPNTVTYSPEKKINDYVSYAGGYGNRAKKGGAYIVYMNGMVARRKGNARKQIEPGCEIVVPLKPVRRGMSVGEIMSLATSTSSMAAMITSIINTTK